MLSIALQDKRGPTPVLRWSPATHRMIEAARDRIMSACGTHEPLIEDRDTTVTRIWRKPLSLEEVNRMAPTPDVRARRGRP